MANHSPGSININDVLKSEIIKASNNVWGVPNMRPMQLLVASALLHPPLSLITFLRYM